MDRRLLTRNFLEGLDISFELDWFRDVEEMPFEMTTIPVPVGYEGFLRYRFGEDYLEMKREGTDHMGAVFSADIPYTEYLEQSKKKTEHAPSK